MGYNYLTEYKNLWEKEKLLVMSNFFISHYVFKSCLLLMCQNEYLWSKGLTNPSVLMTLTKRNFKNFVGKEENADNHF